MCLIITGESAKIRSTLLNTHALLDDIYTSNSDGIGIMYATTKGLKVVKVLPKSLADATHFISKLPTDDRQLAIHFRMTTHGHTDMTNCHPYDVIPGYVAMMHNGILHTGNAADKSKSDTWHFIKDFLTSPVTEHPPLIHNPQFLDMIAEFIGDNRFVFMDGEGKLSHVNKDQGIEHDGLWFSNTYAWRPSRLIPKYQYSTRYSSRHYNYMYDYDNDAYYDRKYGGFKSLPANAFKDDDGVYEIKPRKISAHDPRWDEDDYEFDDVVESDDYIPEPDEVLAVLMAADVDAVTEALELYPENMVHVMCNSLKCEATPWTTVDDMTELEASLYHAFLAGDTVSLLDAIDNGTHGNVADVACYYLNWSLRSAKQVLPALI